MLKRSYEPPCSNETTLALAKKVTLLVVDSNVTYKDAVDVLELALGMLETQTRPVIASVPAQAGSELKP